MSTPRTYGRNPNHHRVKFYEFKGERRTLVEWARRTGLSYTCVQNRFYRGVPLDMPKSKRGRPIGFSPAKTQAAKKEAPK